MAGSPQYKVYRGKEYVASVKHLEDAAALCAISPTGTTVRLGHSTVLWTEGAEELLAGESHYRAAEIMRGRENALP
jgi:hypothetical protein